MLSLLAASQIASIAGNAVSIIDKVYSQFTAFKTGNKESPTSAPHSAKIVNEQDQRRISSLTDGHSIQSVTYAELAARLSPSDLDVPSRQREGPE